MRAPSLAISSRAGVLLLAQRQGKTDDPLSPCFFQLENETRVTCTACAGTLLLEFGTLSRLTGNGTYAELASRALDEIYCACFGWDGCRRRGQCVRGKLVSHVKVNGRRVVIDPCNSVGATWHAARRSRLGLVGKTIHVDTGQWMTKQAGIGAGQDSYYEYLLKVLRDPPCRNVGGWVAKQTVWLHLPLLEGASAMIVARAAHQAALPSDEHLQASCG